MRSVFYLFLGFAVLSSALGAADLPNLARLKLEAEGGDRVAQYEYAQKISLSNAAERIVWITKSAEQGYPLAQEALAAHLATSFATKAKSKEILEREAALWASRAAFQGLAAAQARLARAYQRGAGLPKNDIAAYMWMSIAIQSASGINSYKAERDNLIARMSSASIAEGQRLAEQFRIEKYAQKMNPVEADLIFGQLKLSAVYLVKDGTGAVLNNVRFAPGETKKVTRDGKSVELTCRDVQAKSVRVGIPATEFETTVPLGK